MYDAEGPEITDNFKISEVANSLATPNIYKAELFMLDIFIAIVVILGFIFTRYFINLIRLIFKPKT